MPPSRQAAPGAPSTAGETLVREGERSDYFFVILSGKVAVTTTDDAGNRHVIRVHGPGRFLGELGDLEGQAAFYTAEVVEPGEVLVVPTERVRALVAHDPALSDLILRAYLLRRSLLIQEGIRIPDHRLLLCPRYRAAARIRCAKPVTAQMD